MDARELEQMLEGMARPVEGPLRLQGPELAGAQLKGLRIDGARYGGVVFGEADGTALSMVETDLSEAALSNCSFHNVNLGNANLSRCKMRRSELLAVSLLDADLQDADLGSDKASGFANGQLFREVQFGVHRKPGGPLPANLKRASARGSRFERCRFNYVMFDDTDLRLCELRLCDLRYAWFRNATLQDSELKWCDLYRSYFDSGTVFAPRELDGISITRAWLAGIVELTSEAFRARGPAPLIQEQSSDSYYAFLEATTDDRPDDPRRAMKLRFTDAAAVYRQLAGVWQAQGKYADAGWAYVHSKRLERRASRPGTRTPPPPASSGQDEATTGSSSAEDPAAAVTHEVPTHSHPIELPVKESSQWGAMRRAHEVVGARRAAIADKHAIAFLADLWRWSVLWIADVLCSFGESLLRVLLWLAAVAFGPGIVYALFGGVSQLKSGERVGIEGGGFLLTQTARATRALGDCLLFSVSALTNSVPTHLRASNRLVETVGVAQTFAGIALLGLLGFVLGNKLRNS
ncbi:MAG TPA: pentapeptide repeat-containing protein [Solirubrobacteraceae bacterium]|jgi:uncharacterized protein YjbI with pentapeptide repeats